VAGKGHERYQIIGTTRHRYDDADVLRKELSRLGYA
jgi:UDP-N-acetylmuramyl tripeptide synthase